jgi:hypothetical protein
MIGLIFLREFATKKEAVNFETRLKKLRNKEYIQATFSEFFISGCPRFIGAVAYPNGIN